MKVALAESYADGQAARKELNDQYDNDSTYDAETLAAMWTVYAERPRRQEQASDSFLCASHSSHLAAFAKARPKKSLYYIEEPDAVSSGRPRVFRAERKAQAALLRDIVGNPFRPISINSFSLTSSVTALAQSIYTDQGFDRLPILADALEEAGCTDTEILGHLRGPGPHVRGCWAIDAILGKE